MASKAEASGHLPDNMALPLILLSCLSSVLSMFGSGCVLYMARRQLDQLMHRFLMTSITLFLMPFLMPSEIGLLGASGTFDNCVAVGFSFWCFFTIGATYNCYLSCYYLATIRYNWKGNQSMSTSSSRHCSNLLNVPKWEFALHLCVVVAPLSYLIAAVVTEAIGPHGVMPICTVTTYPWGCDQNEENRVRTVFPYYVLHNGSCCGWLLAPGYTVGPFCYSLCV